MSDVLSWGIAGTGHVAETSCRALLKADNAEVVAVASEEGGLDRAQAFAGRFGLTRGNAYAKYAKMIDDENVQAVYIATVTRRKKELAEQAIKAGKHVLIETPAAVRTSDLAYIIKLSQHHRVQFMTGCLFPHNPRTVAVVRELRGECDRFFGDVQYVMAHHSYPCTSVSDFVNNDIRMNKNLEPMGALGALGWPCVRFAVEMFRTQDGNVQKAKEVTCSFNRMIRGTPTSAVCTIIFENGGCATFNVSFDQCEDQRVSVSCPARSIDIIDFVTPHNSSKSGYERKDNAINRGIEKKYLTSSVSVPTPTTQETHMFRTFSHLALSLRGKGGGLSFVNEERHKRWADLALETQRILDAAVGSATATTRGIPMLINRG